MPDAELEWRRAVRRYVAELAEVAGLRDWTVEVEDDPETPPHLYAHAEVAYGRKHLVVRLGEEFWKGSPEEQRSTAIHELMHAHLDCVMGVVRDLETQLGSWLFEVINEQAKRQNENATDAVAEVIAKWLPLPPARPS